MKGPFDPQRGCDPLVKNHWSRGYTIDSPEERLPTGDHSYVSVSGEGCALQNGLVCVDPEACTD